MDPFRDELDAAHERIEHLERELAEARGKNDPPVQAPAAATPPVTPAAPRGPARVRAAGRLAVVALVGLGGYLLYPHVFSGEWEGVHGAILTDVNGDGVTDILGRIRHVSADRITLAASDGKTGRRLWESETLGSYIDTYQGALGLAGDTLLYAAPGGDMRAYGARDGKNRWVGRLPEKVKSFCAGHHSGEVRIQLADDVVVTVALADGRSGGSTGEAGGACDPLADDSSQSNRRSVAQSPDGPIEVESPRHETTALADEMNVSYALRRPGGPTVLFGSRKKGTSVPMIGAVYDDAARARSWARDMPSNDALQTSAEPFVHGTISSTSAFATYERGSSDAHVLVCFDLTGKRQWETPLPSTHPLTLLQTSDDRVLVSQWGQLTVYDAKSGVVRFAIGG